MVFATLVFLDMGILLLYSAYKDMSPFDVLREFIAGENQDESE